MARADDRREIEIALLEETMSAPSDAAGSLAPGLEPTGASPHRGDAAYQAMPAPSAGQAIGTDQGDSYTLDPTSEPSAPRVDLGISPGSWMKWGAFGAPPGPGATGDSESVARAPAPASSTGGLAETLDSYDRDTGLGPSGAVLSAAREAGSSPAAPRSGTAQFAITVYQGGHVDVALAGFSGDPASWTEVGHRIESTLRLKPPHIKSTRRGARIVIELAAVERWPSGAPTRADAAHTSVTPPALRSTEDAKVDLQKRNPAAAPDPGAPAERRAFAPIVDAPGVFVGGRARLGDIAIGAGAVGELGYGDPGHKVDPGLIIKGNVDPTNMVGRATRTVSTRVISESVL